MSTKKTHEDLLNELETLEQQTNNAADEYYEYCNCLENAIYPQETDDGYLKPLSEMKIRGLAVNVNLALKNYNKLSKLVKRKERLLQKRT